jgi:hypothetical protein
MSKENGIRLVSGGGQGGFPIRETFEDFAGRKRNFVIDCHEGPLGYTVRAIEEKPKGEGYEFAAYSETTPDAALGRLREKARRSMAVRHLSSDRNLLHDTLTGRITSDRKRGLFLVVDGIAVDMEDLTRLLETHEGYEFELRIKDPVE